MSGTATNRARLPSRWQLVAAAIVVLLAAWVFWSSRGPATSDADAAPDITLEYFDGTSQRLGDLRGTPVVLNFWASWCPACVTEMPAFGEVHRRLGDRVVFIGINMQEVDFDAAVALAAQAGVDYRLAHDPTGAIFRRFGGIAMPTTVFIAADGSVERTHAGAIFAEELAALIEAALPG